MLNVIAFLSKKHCTCLSLFKPLYQFFVSMLLDKIFQNPLQYFEEF